MVYRKNHPKCNIEGCQSYSAYIRIKNRWVKVGFYHSKCKGFTSKLEIEAVDLLLLKNRNWANLLG